MHPSPRSITPAPTTPTIRLRSPGEVVSAIPYLLGFAPERSLVLVGLHAKQLVLTCRLDLEDVLDRRCAESVIEALRRAGAGRALLVAHGDDRTVTGDAMASMADRLAMAGIVAGDQISVVNGRWFDEGCTDSRCCPPEGVAIADYDCAPSTIGFHALGSGYVADRDALVAECHPDRPLLVAAIRAEVHRIASTGPGLDDAAVVDGLASVLGWGGGDDLPQAAAIACAAVASVDPLVRDVCYAAVAPEMMGDFRPDLHAIHAALVSAGRTAGDLGPEGVLLDPDARERVLCRVMAWVRNLPDDVPSVTMPALVVAAVAQWCAGDGARARTLIERAQSLEGEPLPMLRTLMTALSHGVGPPELGRRGGDSPGDGRAHRAIA